MQIEVKHCHLVCKHKVFPYCEWEVMLSCGHRILWPIEDDKPDFCPKCGAIVENWVGNGTDETN